MYAQDDLNFSVQDTVTASFVSKQLLLFVTILLRMVSCARTVSDDAMYINIIILYLIMFKKLSCEI